MKAFVLALLSLTVLASFFGCRNSPVEVTDAEYSVLSAYIGGKFARQEGVRQIVIFSETVSGGERPDDTPELIDVPALKKSYGQVYSAYLNANLHPKSFHSSFTLPIPYQVVAPSEVRLILGTPGDIWGRYYEKYPNSTGLLHASRVGFSSDGHQAAFYISNHCGGLCGGGYFVVMEKFSLNWKVVQEVQVWVS